MSANTDWAARLIDSHRDALTERALDLARAQIPWYHSQSPDTLRRMFSDDYRALAQVLRTNDTAALRTHIEQVATECIHRGAPAAGLIAMASLLEESVRALIEREAANPAVAAEATRRVQVITKNISMILSGVNLRLLTQSQQPPPDRSMHP